ncbi:MAG: hypothetical protein ABL921_05715 [Pirellula sp.]
MASHVFGTRYRLNSVSVCIAKPYVLHANRAWRAGCAWHCEARLNREYAALQTIVLPVWWPHVSRYSNEGYSIWREVLLGPIRTRRNTPAFGSEISFGNFFWASICIAHAQRLRGKFTGLEFCFDPRTTAFRLRPTLFLSIFGAAVFIIGAFLGCFPIQFLGKQTAVITAEDLGGMNGHKKSIAGLQQAIALRRGRRVLRSDQNRIKI